MDKRAEGGFILNGGRFSRRLLFAVTRVTCLQVGHFPFLLGTECSPIGSER